MVISVRSQSEKLDVKSLSWLFVSGGVLVARMALLNI